MRSRLLPLLRLARRSGAFINVDMEQHRYKDLVHHVFADALLEPEFREFSDVGIVVQAYLRDADDDIARLRALAERRGAPFSVRLVKGAYWEEERIVAAQNDWPVPVYEAKAATDASLRALHRRPARRVAAPAPGLRHAQPALDRPGRGQSHRRAASPDGIEFQMLFGMAEELRTAVVAEGYRTRVYVPVGAVVPGMAYLVRRLLENTSNQSWFIKGESSESWEALLAAPLPDDAPPAEPAQNFQNAPTIMLHNARRPRRRCRGALGGAKRLRRRRSRCSWPAVRLRDRKLDDVRYPADPSVLVGRVAQATRADVDDAVEAARAAFPAWRDLGVEQRAAIMRRAADVMLSRRYELAALMVYESAKPIREADGDVTEAVDYLRYYADQAERLLQPVAMNPVMGEDNVYLREARGVTAVIAPWNFPLAIITGMSSAALVAGNCAILKPAAQSPLIAARLAEILHEAGVPRDVLQYLPGPGSEVGAAAGRAPGRRDDRVHRQQGGWSRPAAVGRGAASRADSGQTRRGGDGRQERDHRRRGRRPRPGDQRRHRLGVWLRRARNAAPAAA